MFMYLNVYLNYKYQHLNHHLYYQEALFRSHLVVPHSMEISGAKNLLVGFSGFRASDPVSRGRHIEPPLKLAAQPSFLPTQPWSRVFFQNSRLI